MITTRELEVNETAIPAGTDVQVIGAAKFGPHILISVAGVGTSMVHPSALAS